jgi:hypothetical protein
MRLLWSELEQDLRWSGFKSDFGWAALAAPTYEMANPAATSGNGTRRRGAELNVDGQLSPSAPTSITALSSIAPLTLNDGTSPPVGAPAADVTRKTNFDGSGRDDLVFRAANSRDVIVFASNGTRYTLAAPADSRLLAIADFTGDGIADLLFGSVTGPNPRFQVTAVTNTAGVPTIPGTGDFSFNSVLTGRVALGIGDFDGNGRADILRRDVSDVGAGTGTVLSNLNNGTAFSNTDTVFANLALSWSMAGIGDINGDGRDDMIWRNANNTVSAWLMGANGVAFTSAGLPSVGHEWRLEAVTRLNSNDQLNDLVWRNVVSGRTIGWIMSATGGASLGSVVELGTFGFDLEYVGATYSASGAGNGGGSPQLVWRRTDGSTLATNLLSSGAASSDQLLVNYTPTETHFRTKIPEAFDFGARGMWGPYDVLEPMRTRNFGGVGVSGGNTGRIPLVQAEGGLTVLYAAGGGLTQFTPQAAAGGNFTLNRNWVLVGMGDFDGDGVGIDLLYRDSLGTDSGFVSRWNATTSRYEIGSPVSMLSLPIDGRIIGFGQVDTASIGTDIVWQNRDGLVGVSRVDTTSGGDIDSTTSARTRIQSRDWIGQGVTDLNGDGRGDIVWRNAKTGSISYWTMGATGDALRQVTEVFINTTPVTLEWDLVGMGDLDGDGDGDLIWRRNTDGFTAAWLFAGGQLSSVAGITTRGWDWRFEGTSDVNGDGKTDLVWRNASGQYAADLMNGTTVTSTILSGAILFDRATMGWNQAFMRSL